MLPDLAFALWLAFTVTGDPSDEDTAQRSEARIVTASSPRTPWIRYRLGPGETIDDLATRYGVTVAQIVDANAGVHAFKKGDVVRLQPQRFVAPRASRTIKVSERRTWVEIAARYDVDPADLRAWNRRFAKRDWVPEGATLTVWFSSGVRRFADPEPASPLPDFEVTPSGFSVGKPNRGRIDNAVPLPKSEDYTVRFERLAWGSSSTVRNIQRALAGFRRDSGFAGPIYIGAMSQKSGRRLDVRMPAMPHVEGHKLASNEIDWHATWMMVDAFIRTDAVQVIFLERKLFARLRSAGLRMGATDERIAAVMGAIRHSQGHTSHIHVRFDCAADAPNCDQVD